MKIRISDKSYDEGFVREVEEISGENFHTCMQCGTCSGTCPMAGDMDLFPRQVVLMSHYGLRDPVQDSRTAWVCASCHACMVRCPRGLDIPKIMEAIRQISLRKNHDYIRPEDIPPEILKEVPQIALVSCFRKHTP